MKKVILILPILFFGLIGSGNAALINFDTLTPGTYEKLVYSEVTITDLYSGNVMVLANGDGGTGYASPYNNIAASNWTEGYGLLLTFANPVNSMSIVGGDGGYDIDRFKLEAYDSDWNFLGSTDTGDFSGADSPPIAGATYKDYRTLEIDFTAMKYVKVIQVNWGVGFDDLQFNMVPLPPTLVLLGSGLLGFIGLRKRQWKKTF